VQQAQRQVLALSGAGTELADRLARLETSTGAAPVTGPGMVVRLDDAPGNGDGADVDPRTDVDTSGRVTDRDLQTVVNEVWAAGAEAVSVNGQRLTALSAIRAAGDAILVDNKPLVPPYTVLAVGDGQRLSTRFQNSPDGMYLHALQENFGIRTSISAQDDIRLPAAPSVIVRTAQPRAEQKGTS
jgi:uncharacterized protein YlxW (UPF0749 family)